MPSRKRTWMMEQGRIELLGESLRRIKEERERRDLSDVPTAKLIELELKLSTQLAKEFSAPHIRSERELLENKALRAALESAGAPLNPSPEQPILMLASEDSGNGKNRRRRADSN